MNPLQQLQADVTALLLGNPAMAAVPYTSFRKEAIQSMADEAAAAWKVRSPGQLGVACLVLMPSLRVITPNVPGPQYNISITIRTFHDPKVNTTGLSCEDVAMANIAWLDGEIFEGLTQLNGDPQGDALKANYGYPGFLVYDSTLVGPLPQQMPGRTFPPDILEDGGGHITLPCADPSAVVYYTLDGSLPIPPYGVTPAPGGTGYTGPIHVYGGAFTAAAGLTLRAVAWNPALMPSHAAQGTIS